MLGHDATRPTDCSGSVGTFGWDGGSDTTWYCDLPDDLVSIQMTQATWISPSPPEVCLVGTTACETIDE